MRIRLDLDATIAKVYRQKVAEVRDRMEEQTDPAKRERLREILDEMVEFLEAYDAERRE